MFAIFSFASFLLPGVCSNQGAGASGASVKKSIWATDPFPGVLSIGSWILSFAPQKPR